MNNHELQKKIDALPHNIKKAIDEFDWAEQIMNIGRAHNLHLDDIEQFRQQTLLVIVGTLPADSYQSALTKHIGIDRDTANSLVQASNELIFSELQRRAFGDTIENQEVEDIDEFIHHDLYHEPIHPDDVRGIMRNEGVQLIDEDEETVQHFQEPSDAISYQNDLNVSTEITSDATNKQNQVAVDSSQLSSPQDYLEPIREEDLEGVPNYHVESTRVIHSGKQDFSTRFDQLVMNDSFISKNDVLDVSPEKSEHSENFLKNLGK